jgi:hypothetical protein
MIRKNFEFSERYIELLARLKEVCDLKTETSVVEEALVLFAWAVNEVTEGHTIGAYDGDRKLLREITSSALEKARHWKPEKDVRAATA